MVFDKNLIKDLSKASDLVYNSLQTGKTLYITHNDCDGLTSAAIGLKMFSRACGRKNVYVWSENGEYIVKGLQDKVDFKCMPVPSKEELDELITEINSNNYDLVVFSDFGSSYLPELSKISTQVIVLDHHKTLDTQYDNILEINPYNYGLSGENAGSGASLTYFLARTMDEKNKDLAGLGILGAVGDIQEVNNELISLNKEILKDAEVTESEYKIKRHHGVRVYGRDTVPIAKAFLIYSPIPLAEALEAKFKFGSFDKYKLAKKFDNIIQGWGIPTENGDRKYTLSDLTESQQKKLVKKIWEELIEPHTDFEQGEYNSRLFGDVYLFENFEKNTKYHNVEEFTTLMNACGKGGAPRIAINALLGHGQSREWVVDRYNSYKQRIAITLSYIKKDPDMVDERENVTYIDLTKHGSPGITGVIATIQANDVYDKTPKIVVAFAERDGVIKASIRQSIYSDKDLAEAISEAAENVGGIGGGHPCAAGAKFPSKHLEKFKSYLDKILN
jgi:RecJ-like exonuclease